MKDLTKAINKIEFSITELKRINDELTKEIEYKNNKLKKYAAIVEAVCKRKCSAYGKCNSSCPVHKFKNED